MRLLWTNYEREYWNASCFKCFKGDSFDLEIERVKSFLMFNFEVVQKLIMADKNILKNGFGFVIKIVKKIKYK